jgi:hypothetical protein
MLVLLTSLMEMIGVTCKTPMGGAERMYVKTKRDRLDSLYRDTLEYTKGGALVKVIDLQHAVVADTLVAMTAFKEFPEPLEVSA